MSPSDILYFLRALIALILKPRRSIPKNIHTVAVLAPAKMGDMVCTTPVFHALRMHMPDVRIIVLGDKTNEALMAGSPDIDRYIVYNYREPATAIADLNKEHVDIALLSVPTAPGLAFLALSNATAIIAPTMVGGTSPHETKTYRLLSRFVRLVPHHFGNYVPGEYLKLLLPLGITTTDTTKHLAVTDVAKARTQEILKDLPRPLVGIAPGAGNKIKLWPPERFAAVADHCIETYAATVVLIAGKRDEEDAKNMFASVKNKNALVDLTSKLSVEELKAVIAELDLFVASDTGPIYIAEAFDIATVNIVGPVAEGEQPPQGPNHISIVPTRSEPAIHVMSTTIYDPNEVEHQAKATTVSEVTAAIDMLMKDVRVPQ